MHKSRIITYLLLFQTLMQPLSYAVATPTGSPSGTNCDALKTCGITNETLKHCCADRATTEIFADQAANGTGGSLCEKYSVKAFVDKIAAACTEAGTGCPQPICPAPVAATQTPDPIPTPVVAAPPPAQAPPASDTGGRRSHGHDDDGGIFSGTGGLLLAGGIGLLAGGVIGGIIGNKIGYNNGYNDMRNSLYGPQYGSMMPGFPGPTGIPSQFYPPVPAYFNTVGGQGQSILPAYYRAPIGPGGYSAGAGAFQGLGYGQGLPGINGYGGSTYNYGGYNLGGTNTFNTGGFAPAVLPFPGPTAI